jgi:hypothetical protein
MTKIISLWHQYQISNGEQVSAVPEIDSTRTEQGKKQSDMMDDFFSFMATTTSQRNSVIIYEEMYMRACKISW